MEVEQSRLESWDRQESEGYTYLQILRHAQVALRLDPGSREVLAPMVSDAFPKRENATCINKLFEHTTGLWLGYLSMISLFCCERAGSGATSIEYLSGSLVERSVRKWYTSIETLVELEDESVITSSTFK